jgi:putative ABC transport system permease protein
VNLDTPLSRWRLLNARYVRGHAARSLLSIGVVGLSAALIVAVSGTYGSLTGSVARFEKQVTGLADLEVSGVTDTGLDESLVPWIAATPGVAAAAPIVRASVTVAGRRALLLGVDERAASVSDDLRQGLRSVPRSALPRADGVVVGPGLDTGAHAVPGTTARLATASGAARDVRVLDVAQQPSARRLNHGYFVIAPLPLAQRLTGRGGRVDSVLVVAHHGVDGGALQRRLSTVVAGRADVAPPGERAAQAEASTGLTRNITLLVALMAFVVAGFLMFNSMNMAATERRTEVATLRVLGGRRRQVMRDFLVESVVLGLSGAALGVPVGIVLGRLAIARLPPFLTASFDVEVGFALPGYAVPIAVVACVGACLLAAALPARRTFSVEPVEALRPTGLGETQRSGGRWPVGLVGVAAIAVAVGVIVTAGTGTYILGAGPILLLGVILLAYALTSPISALTARSALMMGVPGRIAATAIERSPRRVWATTLTVAMGVAIGVTTVGASRNAVDAASASVASLGRADYVVQTTPSDVIPAGPLLPPPAVHQIAALPGVAGTSPGQITYATQEGVRILVVGLSPGSVSPQVSVARPEARQAVLSGRGAVISRRYAQDHHLAVGDRLRISTPTGERWLRVADVIGYISVERGMITISMDHLQRWYRRPGAGFVEVRLRDGADRAAFTAAAGRLARTLPYKVYVVTGAEEVAATQSAVQQAGSISLALQLIITGIAGVALFNTIMLSVVERRREIGIIRAVGASRRLIRRSVLAEAGAVSLVGGAIGLGIGIALHFVSDVLLGRTMALTVPFHFEPVVLALAVAALLLALIGSLPPAFRAGRLDIVEAIGYE